MALALLMSIGVIASCDKNHDSQHVTSIEYFGPQFNLKIGEIVRVYGLLTLNDNGDIALTFRSGSGKYSSWDCAVLQDLSLFQRMKLPFSQPKDFQMRSFKAVGLVSARDVTFGKLTGHHKSRQCLFAIKVESLERSEMSADVMKRLLRRPY